MQITWFGTACIRIQTEESVLLFDPFVPWKGSPAPIHLSDFDAYPDIFITHGHFDHIESLPDIVKRNPDVKIYCTKTPYRTLVRAGIEKENLKKIAPYKQTVTGDVRIRTYPGKHADLETDPKDRILDKRLLSYGYNLPHAALANVLCRENREILLYEINAEGKRVLLLGSMNLPEEKILQKDERSVSYPDRCDVLILPYVGYFDNLKQAKRILARLNPEKVILSHFDDTFPPLTRPVDTKEIEEAGLDCEVIRPDYKIPIHV